MTFIFAEALFVLKPEKTSHKEESGFFNASLFRENEPACSRRLSPRLFAQFSRSWGHWRGWEC
jgi:hypothetical protein